MLLHDDLMYQILLWLPVVTLLRFKLVCRTWRALIESNGFIKQHLHHHHYNPNLKGKNHNLIHIVEGKDSPFTFPLISIDGFERPNACVQLDCSDLREYFPLRVLDIASYNGIVCLHLLGRKRKHRICLWNPATKQSRVLPQPPALTLETKHSRRLVVKLGFGFDVKNNDHKVVNLFRNHYNDEERVEVYSLNTDSWRSVTAVFPFSSLSRDPRIPFNNGTCFFWTALNSGSEMIICFDFSSEKFRSISFHSANQHVFNRYASVISDKIASVSVGFDRQTEIWVFNEYGSVNESWIKLYTIDPCVYRNKRIAVEWLSMNGNHFFFSPTGTIIRYNIVTKEIKILPTIAGLDYSSLRLYCSAGALVEFKESLLSVGKENNEWIERNDSQLNF